MKFVEYFVTINQFLMISKKEKQHNNMQTHSDTYEGSNKAEQGLKISTTILVFPTHEMQKSMFAISHVEMILSHLPIDELHALHTYIVQEI